MIANGLLAEVESARAQVAFTKRVRTLASLASVVCLLGIPGGIWLGIWSNLHPLNFGGLCFLLGLLGVVGALLAFYAVVIGGEELLRDQRNLRLREAEYHDALNRDLGGTV